MTNFFKHAPVQETYQKRFMEAIFQRQHVIAGFPLAYPVVSVYGLAAMMGEGMAVVVSPDTAQVRRNLAYFKNAGFRFPEVAYLDGTQAPHEERAVQKEINHNRVKLLYVTPERFISLTFLEILVHAPVTFLAIEEADRLLPGMPGHGFYKRFHREGLSQLRRLPPLVLLTPPLAPYRVRELSGWLNLHTFQSLPCLPQFESARLRVACLLTEYQKYRVLLKVLSGSPAKGKTGRLDGTGAVLIQTAHPAQAEKLTASLRDYGFESVWALHHKKSPREMAQIAELAGSRLNSVVVNAGVNVRHWQPPSEAKPRVVLWSPPANVDDLFMQVFRQPQELPPGLGKAPLNRALVLYTREDYQAAFDRLQSNHYLEPEELDERAQGLRHFRQWVLSESCRLQSLAAYYHGGVETTLSPCGFCDRCLEARQGGKFIRRVLKRWFF